MAAFLSGFAWWHQPLCITELKLVQADGQSEIFIGMKQIVDPIVEIEPENSAVRFDFPGVLAGGKILSQVLADKHVALGYVFNHKGNLQVAGLRLFLRNAGLKAVKHSEKGIQIILAQNSANSLKGRYFSETLLDPEEEKFAPVSLSLQGAPAMPVIQELARKAEIDLKFSGNIPEQITVNVDAASALEALRAIATGIGGKFEQRQKTWWMLGAEI